MAQLSGWVAGWTDGDETNCISIWTDPDEAKADCQQDVRDGEDMGLTPDQAALLDSDRYTLEWEPGDDWSFTADAENGQGTYFVHWVPA